MAGKSVDVEAHLGTGREGASGSFFHGHPIGYIVNVFVVDGDRVGKAAGKVVVGA